MTAIGFTSRDLEALPDRPGWRYEIIGGELHVTKAPGWGHQVVTSRTDRALGEWNDETRLGQIAIGPGLVFADDDDAIPDLVWASHGRLRSVLGADGHLHGPPELVVEVLSPGASNRRRDRELKLALYDRRGVDEYWIADVEAGRIEVFCRDRGALRLAATLGEGDTLTSPVLPGFACAVGPLFARVLPR